MKPGKVRRNTEYIRKTEDGLIFSCTLIEFDDGSAWVYGYELEACFESCNDAQEQAVAYLLAHGYRPRAGST